MKIIIIGNGVAGTFTAQNIRTLDKTAEIEIYSQEKYPYYTRVKLPEIISEQVKIEDLIVFKEDWYKKNNIKSHLNKKIQKILPKEKKILVEGQTDPISYDKLVLATGSIPNLLPIKNAKELFKKGVFTLRNIEDAYEIRNYIKSKKVKKAIIIGGGLLGLELAKQIRNCKLDTMVVEFFPRLLPKQLDVDCADMLKEEIEEMGIKVVLNVNTEEILGDGSVKGIKLKDGRQFDAELVLIQAGIVPIIDLAKDAKLTVNKGIVVNEILETSEKDVFAVGDCIEYKNQTWGIIPACLEQSKIIASSVLGKKSVEYVGTTPKNTLKIVGVDLTSVGVFDPQKEPGWEVLRKIDKKSKCYVKIVLKDNKLKGAIIFGDKEGIPYVNQNIENNVNKEEVKKVFQFDKWVCGKCSWEYDESKLETAFESLPDDYKCFKCKAPKSTFKKSE